MPQVHQFCRDSSRMREQRQRTLSESSCGSQDSQDSAVGLSPLKPSMAGRPPVQKAAAKCDPRVEAVPPLVKANPKRRLDSSIPEQTNSQPSKRARQESVRQAGRKKQQTRFNSKLGKLVQKQVEAERLRKAPATYAHMNSAERQVNLSDSSEDDEDSPPQQGQHSTGGCINRTAPPGGSNHVHHVRPTTRTVGVQVDSGQDNMSRLLEPLTEKEQFDMNMEQMIKVWANYVEYRFKHVSVPLEKANHSVVKFATMLKLSCYDESASCMETVWDFMKTLEGSTPTYNFLRRKLVEFKVEEELRREEVARLCGRVNNPWIAAKNLQCNTAGNAECNGSGNVQSHAVGKQQLNPPVNSHSIQAESKASLPVPPPHLSPPWHVRVQDTNKHSKRNEVHGSITPPTVQQVNKGPPPVPNPPPLIKQEPPEPNDHLDTDDGFQLYTPNSEPTRHPPPLCQLTLPTRVVNFDNNTQNTKTSNCLSNGNNFNTTLGNAMHLPRNFRGGDVKLFANKRP